MESWIAVYIWTDAKGQLRSKSKTLFQKDKPAAESLEEWNFDGSSTGQAHSHNSEIILRPKKIFDNPFHTDRTIGSVLVWCDCYDIDGRAIESNTRYEAQQFFAHTHVVNQEPWFGFEQEYILYDRETLRPLGWPTHGLPEPQDKYYCGVGSGKVFRRDIIDKHYLLCLKSGIKIGGTNAEVMPGQWEFQIGPCVGIEAADHLWIARYILEMICEENNLIVSYEPKPYKDFNGSGLHTNFSTTQMREKGGYKYILSVIEKMQSRHSHDIRYFGTNDKRLTGKHETSSKDKFTFGVGDRSASVRIPSKVIQQDCGYIEDRRPASDADIYLVMKTLIETTLLS